MVIISYRSKVTDFKGITEVFSMVAAALFLHHQEEILEKSCSTNAAQVLGGYF